MSAYLFITALENLAINIRSDISIKRININKKELKVSLLADDITMLLNDLTSVKSSRVVLKDFHQCSGLKINVDKNANYLDNNDYFPHGIWWIIMPIDTRHHHHWQLRTKLQTQLSKKNHQPENNTQYLETEKTITKRDNYCN